MPTTTTPTAGGETLATQPGSTREDDVYRENVNRLMEAGSSDIISNSLPKHAAALLECFFRNAKSEMRIVCNSLRSEVYDSGEVLNSFAAAVDRGVSVQILVREAHPETSKFSRLAECLADRKNLLIHYQTANSSKLLAARTENFAVMDRRAFRYEADSRKVEAVASMNAPVISDRLDQIFTRLLQSLRTGDAVATPC